MATSEDDSAEKDGTKIKGCT